MNLQGPLSHSPKYRCSCLCRQGEGSKTACPPMPWIRQEVALKGRKGLRCWRYIFCLQMSCWSSSWAVMNEILMSWTIRINSIKKRTGYRRIQYVLPLFCRTRRFKIFFSKVGIYFLLYLKSTSMVPLPQQQGSKNLCGNLHPELTLKGQLREIFGLGFFHGSTLYEAYTYI